MCSPEYLDTHGPLQASDLGTHVFEEDGVTAGRIALVVGAGDFLGSAIAKRFAREGFHVVATRRRGDLEKLVDAIEAAGGRASGFHSDARDEEQVIQLVDAINRVVTDAGRLTRSWFATCSRATR